MGSKRRGRQAGRLNRDAETIGMINDLLHADPVDVTRLRKLAAVRGLVNDGLRTRVWPLLLGVDTTEDLDAVDYEARHSLSHADSHVVVCDMERSLWSFTEGWGEGAREERRAALRRVLDAVVDSNKMGLYYYQGLHDIASVLLFVCGERLAFRLLAHLASCHLRDCTRRDLAAATEVLKLLYPILEACDPGLHAYIQGLAEPALEVPYFALSWYMTWFAHDVASLPQAARLFDLFLASHPLMPLYVAAVAITSCRARILACGDDGLEVYATLKRMRILQPGQPNADELAREAAALYQVVPPTALMRRKGIQLDQSVAADAYLEGGRWHVPPEPGRRGAAGGHAARLAQQTVAQLQALFRQPAAAEPESAAEAAAMAVGQRPPPAHPEQPRPKRRRPTLTALLASATGVAALGAAVLLSQLGSSGWTAPQWH